MIEFGPRRRGGRLLFDRHFLMTTHLDDVIEIPWWGRSPSEDDRDSRLDVIFVETFKTQIGDTFDLDHSATLLWDRSLGEPYLLRDVFLLPGTQSQSVPGLSVAESNGLSQALTRFIEMTGVDESESESHPHHSTGWDRFHGPPQASNGFLGPFVFLEGLAELGIRHLVSGNKGQDFIEGCRRLLVPRQTHMGVGKRKGALSLHFGLDAGLGMSADGPRGLQDGYSFGVPPSAEKSLTLRHHSWNLVRICRCWRGQRAGGDRTWLRRLISDGPRFSA